MSHSQLFSLKALPSFLNPQKRHRTRKLKWSKINTLTSEYATLFNITNHLKEISQQSFEISRNLDSSKSIKTRNCRLRWRMKETHKSEGKCRHIFLLRCCQSVTASLQYVLPFPLFSLLCWFDWNLPRTHLGRSGGALSVDSFLENISEPIKSINTT